VVGQKRGDVGVYRHDPIVSYLCGHTGGTQTISCLSAVA
jgi:hypothetical protein